MEARSGHRARDEDLDRVLDMLVNSRAYFYRRVEQFGFEDRHLRSVRVSLTVAIPPGDNKVDRSDERAPAFISFGLFEKTKVPDLKIDATGHGPCFPLRKAEMVSLLSAALQGPLNQLVRASFLDLEASMRVQVEALWESLRPEIDAMIRRVVESPEDPARAQIQVLLQLSEGLAKHSSPAQAHLGRVLSDAPLWSHLEPLCGTTLLLAEVPYEYLSDAGLREFVITYSDKWRAQFAMAPDWRPTWGEQRASFADWLFKNLQDGAQRSQGPGWQTVGGLSLAISYVLQVFALKIMSVVGVVGTPMRFSTPNADHAQSYYLLLDLPADVSCNRLYWSAADCRVSVATFPVATGMHWLSGEEVSDVLRFDTSVAIAELQVRRTADLYALCGLSLLLAGVCGYFFRNPVLRDFTASVPTSDVMFGNLVATRQLAVGIGAALVAAPGFAVGLVTRRASDLGSYLSRGLRLLTSVGAFLAVVSGFAIAGLLPEDRGLYSACLFSASLANLSAFLTTGAALMPRGTRHGVLVRRRLARSKLRADQEGRLKHIRRSGVPADSRYRQRRWGILGAALTVAGVSIWAATLKTPREPPILTSEWLLDAPSNLWETSSLVADLRSYASAAAELAQRAGLLGVLLLLGPALLIGVALLQRWAAHELRRPAP